MAIHNQETRKPSSYRMLMQQAIDRVVDAGQAHSHENLDHSQAMAL